MVNVWESVDPVAEARQFSEVYGLGGTVLADADAELAGLLGIRGVPTNVVVDGDGTVRDVGVVTPGELAAAVTRLLGHRDWLEHAGH